MTTIWEQSGQSLIWMVAVISSAVAAVSDIRSRRIPNILTGPLLFTGIAWATVAGGWGGLADSAGAMVVLSLPYLLLFLFAGGGAGDAKLMAALGAWLGLINGLVALAAISIVAIFAAVGYALAGKRMKRVSANIGGIVCRAMLFVFSGGRARDAVTACDEPSDISHMQKMPYGMAIFIGICIAAGGMLLWRA